MQTPLKTQLSEGKPGLGFWLTYPSAPLAKSIIHGGGFNWVLIDGEHGLINDSNYYELNNSISASGVSPIIRIPVAEEWLIKRALDQGAHGVMTPMCHSVEDAKKIVSYSKYPPTGTRGFGPMFTSHSFQTADANYISGADKNLMVIVQIESVQGVENVEEIAKVDGIDCLFIGPFDLSKFMQVEFGGKEHEAAIAKILAAAKAANKTAAIFCTSGAQAKKRLDQGFNMVSIITDLAAVTNSFQRELADANGVEAGAGRTGY